MDLHLSSIVSFARDVPSRIVIRLTHQSGGLLIAGLWARSECDFKVSFIV